MDTNSITSHEPAVPAWIGADPASEKIGEMAAKLAATPSSLPIRRESGTGKDLLAASGQRIERGHLPSFIARSPDLAGKQKPTLEEMESEYIREILKLTRGRKSEAATMLGISRQTLLVNRKRNHLD